MIWASFLLASAASLHVPASSAPILLDGRCDTAEYRRAAKQDLGNGVTLHALHDKHFISLCASLPPDSLGTMDLFLRSPKGGSITNLHISAQVGERIYAEGENPEWQWGNHRGWYGPPVEFRGAATRPDGSARANFGDATGREIRLAKSRFGNGPWLIRMELRAIGPGKSKEVRLPAEAEGWLTMRLR